jgi:hypothetical protein
MLSPCTTIMVAFHRQRRKSETQAASAGPACLIGGLENDRGLPGLGMGGTAFVAIPKGNVKAVARSWPHAQGVKLFT